MTIEVTIARKAVQDPVRRSAGRLLFQDLRLEIPSGQVCAITGRSGIGKSSLLQIVAGLDHDFQGAVTGRPEPIGYLFQSSRLLPWRTAHENLELVLPGRRAEAARWLARVGLQGVEAVHPQRLSVGMARRVSLARALCVEPRLLLLDEPFTALDEGTAEDMRSLLKDVLSRLRPTTLIVTHSMTDAEALADRVVVLDGSPARIVQDHAPAGMRLP